MSEGATQPTSDSYDVVIVGGGMAGLTAAALLACNGTSVLVVDANDRPGGFCRTRVDDGYTIDPGVHLIMGGNADGPFGPGLVFSILDRLGVRDRCDLTRVDPFFTAHFPGRSLVVPDGREAYLEAYRSAFPADAEGIGRLVDLHSRLMREWQGLPIAPGTTDWLAMPRRFPTVFRHARTTVAKVAARHLDDPQARAMYATLWPYVGLPPGRMSFAFWAVMMASYVEEGAYYCRGGFQALADAVAAAVHDHGSELVLGRSVDRIRVRDRAVEGVVLDGGESIRADAVVATGDARRTFGELSNPGELPRRWVRRVRRGEVSMSVLAMYLGTDLDLRSLGVGQEHLVQKSWDLEANWHGALAGGVSGMSVTIPTLADPALAPAGRHHVAIEVVAPSSPDPAAFPQVAEQMVAGAEGLIPDLGDHITFAHGSSTPPAGPGEIPLHEVGPSYGWAESPQLAGPFRLPQTTPVSGLYLAGNWTQPGHGVWTVMISGLRAARLLLGRSVSSGVQSLGL